MSLQEVYLPPEQESLAASSGAPFNINEYLQHILSRWQLILAICVLSGGAGLIHFLMTPRLFRARTTIQIEQSSLLAIGGEQNPWLDAWAGMKYYPTQYRLLRSRGLAERVVLNLGLIDDPEFNPGGSRRPSTASADAGPNEALVARLAGKVLGGLSIDPVSGTELVELSYVSSNPELTARIANGVADAFIDWGIETRSRTVDRASSFLEQQIDTLKDQIDDKERQLQEYSRRSDIVNLDPESNVIIGRLGQLNAGYTAAIGTRLEKEARYKELLETPPQSLADQDPSPLIIDLRRELLDMERDYETKLKVYKPEWPEMVELKARIDDGRQNLDDEIQDHAKSLRRNAYSEYQTTLRRESSLKQQIELAKKDAMNVNFAAVEFKNLEMEITNRRALLDNLLKKLSEAGVTARLQTTRESNVRVVDRALIPGSPFRPSLRNDLTMGLSAGLILGIGLVLLIRFLDRTIKSSEELERLLGLPVLAVIPDVAEKSRGYSYGYYGYGYGDRGAKNKERGKGRQPNPEEVVEIELLPERRPRLAVSEAYRSLRTALLLSSAEELKIVTVTSAEAAEGKTVTAANLAVVMAQMGRRVLLIDADLRKPRMHKLFKASNRVGLVHFLTGGADPEALFVPTSIANLSLCPSGPHPPNPSELLASERMVEFFNLVRQRFDFAVVDTPPVLAVTDAILPGSISDGLILCLRANKVLREDAISCYDRLQMAEVRILGAVLNRYQPVRGSYYDRRRYFYYESYGDSADRSADSAA